MALQKTLIQLNEVVRHCRHSLFYRDRLPKGSLKSLADFERIPLTTPEELLHHSPFGFIAVPAVELFQYYESTTHSVHPVPVWLTEQDVQVEAEQFLASGVHFNAKDIVMVRFPYALSAIAPAITNAAQLQGACVVPVGAHSKVSPFTRVVRLLQKLKVTILACIPLQAFLIAETAQLIGLDPQNDFPGLRAICTAGEVLSPGRRQNLEDIWGVPVFDSYGLAEVGTVVVACRYQHLHPLEEHFYIEIFREDLKTPVTLGQTGWLVVTTLKRQGMPLVRYLTGELARLVPDNCLCGGRVSLEIRGRAQEMVRLSERWLDLWDIEELVSQLPQHRFWIAAPNHDRLQLLVEEEPVSEKPNPASMARTCLELENDFGINLTVNLVPQGTLYDRDELLSIGEVGKPQYIYTAQEMTMEKYFKSTRV